ncbi:MAG TPA: class I SAM-dependent methyltransferase [Anaerolineaceae bacterium]
MTSTLNLDPVRKYFQQKLEAHGATHWGVDYNSDQAMEVRFDQLIKILSTAQAYSLLDFGSGYGAMLAYLMRSGHRVEYYGYDIVEEMVRQGREIFQGMPGVVFTSQFDEIPEVDYAVVSGTFNMKLDASNTDWTGLVIDCITRMNQRSRKGMAFNMLTRYSDPEHMRPDLYYADPCFFFDYCKRNFSKNVAILHDYGLYDFTILVRKE